MRIWQKSASENQLAGECGKHDNLEIGKTSPIASQEIYQVQRYFLAKHANSEFWVRTLKILQWENNT